MAAIPTVRWRNAHKTVNMSAKRFFKHITSKKRRKKYLYYSADIDDFKDKHGQSLIGDLTPMRELMLTPSTSQINVWIGEPHVAAHTHYGIHSLYSRVTLTLLFH